MDILQTILYAGLVLIIAGFLAAHVFTRSIARKVREGVPPRGEFVDVAGGRLHYVDKGQGRPIVLIHGLSGNLENFGYAMIDRLAEDFRVIAVDRPGCGHSTRDNDALARLPNQAAMIAEMIETLELDKPLVVGHSLGGAVSLFMALNHPGQVGGLAMLAPLTAVQETAPSVFKGIDIANPLLRRFIGNTVAIPMSLRQGAAVLKVVFAPETPPEDFRTRGGGLLTLRPEAFYAASTDLRSVSLDIADIQPRYADLACPLGMLYGDGDAVLDHQSHIQAIQRHHPDMPLVLLEGVGHMPIVTRPEETHAFIRDMYAKIT